ncbi:galactose oxidase [Actinoplanes utahensis]|uniref:Galactose oxidase n=2 Tax=Actinoplanes utahensis TaxID=1869 RepID=A0A0A6X0D0_ACTUT|nr:galactose oxidase [Actinoplanes utahensis]
MRVIEEQTKANADRIQRATGLRPGVTPNRRIAADPGADGAWSAVVNTPVVPVFTAVLPNGKLLIWDSVGDNPVETYPSHTFTRAMVFNPANNTAKRVDLQGTNIFCAGFAHLPNGDILIAGGNANAQMAGTVRTYVFNWQAETWTRGADMAAARWYPSVATMANGEEVIIGGGPSVAEVYQTNGAIRKLTGFDKYNQRMYPFMGSRPDTQLGFFGPWLTGFTITTSADGIITGTSTRDSVARIYGSYSTYDVGKTLVVGGGDITENGATRVPTRTAVLLDANNTINPVVTATGSLSTGRRQLNATVLADGSVLATGGMNSAAVDGLVDLQHAVTTAERWDPATGQWSVLSGAARIRQYHSTAALLPDGRVLTGGGGICARCRTVGYLEKNIEYFSPPYLFKKDGSGQLAARPVISGAPATTSGRFTVTTPQAADIRKVALVGLADVTHGVDQGQRYVPLKFTADGTTLTVIGPPSGGSTPPGYYMLFIVDSAGVPSVAKMVQVGFGPKPLMSPIKNSTGRCLDVPGAALASGTYVMTYTCIGSKAQAWNRVGETMRAVGNCLDVPNQNFVTGQRIWAWTCNNGPAQRWQGYADGTIKPLQNTTLCLSAAGSANSAQILVSTCNGSALQKWTL